MESWGHSTVQTACPLDCPDSCTLEVTVKNGRIVEIDGGHENPSTRDYICAKVRRFAERVYGEDRLLYPAIRKGAKGDGVFTRVTWDEALDHIAERMIAIRDRSGGEAILPFCYGGSNGLLTQDTNDAALWRAFGTSRLARTVCAAATGAANMGLYGKMPGVTYEDYPHARLIVLWGVNPSTSGIHLVPFIKEARKAGAQLVVIDPRATSLARQADLHIALRPGTDVAVALALHKHLFDSGHADLAFLAEHAHGVDELRARADEWPMARAAEVAGVDLADLERFAELYAASSPAVIRCGWGLERNRNGGSAVAAVLALPAVAGKFGVRGGGYSMSNSSAFGIKAAAWMNDTPEPATRIVNMNKLGDALLDYSDPAVEMLFVYNCNPLATMPNQNRVLAGLRRDGSLHGSVRAGLHRHGAVRRRRAAGHDLPRELRHRERLRTDQPAARAPRDRACRRGAAEPGRLLRPRPPPRHRRSARRRPKRSCESRAGCRQASAASSSSAASRRRPSAADPIQFVDVFPLTPDRKIDLFPEALEAQAPAGLYALSARPGHGAVSARPDFSREREDGVVDARRAARASRHAADAPGGRRDPRARDRRSRARLQRAR